jgi:drug/metabolite transporter (DMT)-like permease
MRERLYGNFLAVIYNIAWIAFLIFSKMSMGEKSEELKKDLKFFHLKPMAKAYPSNLIVSLSFYIGLITILPFTLWEYFSSGYTFNIATVGSVGLFGLLYMAIMSSIVAYMAYEYGLEYARVSDTALYGYLQPILTLPFAYYIVGEKPDVYMLIGGGIIALGVVIAEARKS